MTRFRDDDEDDEDEEDGEEEGDDMFKKEEDDDEDLNPTTTSTTTPTRTLSPSQEEDAPTPSEPGLGTRWYLLHGSVEHAQRKRTVDAFTRSRGGFLIATDVAARGLDLPSVDLVV